LKTRIEGEDTGSDASDASLEAFNLLTQIAEDTELSDSQLTLQSRHSPQSLKTPTSSTNESSMDCNNEDDKVDSIDYRRLLKWNKTEYHWWLLGAIAAAGNGASQPLYGLLSSEVLTSLGTPEGYFYAYLFIALGFGAFVTHFLQSALFTYAGVKMTRRVREDCFRALLRQEIGFFDEEVNSTGLLLALLAEDTTFMQGLTNNSLSALAQVLGGIATGLILSFLASWQLSLVALGMVPIVAASAILHMKIFVGYGNKTKKAYLASSQKASEAISNIRTIRILGQEHHFVREYHRTLSLPHRKTVEGSFAIGFVYGLSQSSLYLGWCLALYYGSLLMKWRLYRGDQIMQALFCILLTAMAAGQISNFTPDAAKAKLAAISVFKILDRVSKIDVSTSVGEQRPTAEGNFDFEKVEFSYPARPDSQILKGLSLGGKKGMTVALVGKSGCGKSTTMGKKG
jgi:ABC-type multidrug transport system fused ATPase/permease subunit